ncbi:MAG TPA: apolipoprotein N-acyltransferase [Terriglobales bacterium]|nr:apolipoprotein N-acyltransferase [Terriglobales bacterium]
MAAASGGLQVLIFPTPSLSTLCWIALVPLLLAILKQRSTGPELISARGLLLSGTTAWQGFLLGYVSGIIWYAGSCFWVYHVMHAYGGLSAPVALGVLMLFCLYLALYHGAFGALLAHAAHSRSHGLRNALLLAPFLWVAVELARARITGFPWDLLGTAQVDNLPLTRLATFTGVYGLSFIIMLMNCGIVATLYAPRRARQQMLPVAFAIAVMLQLGVFAKLRILPADNTALLVQPNVPLDASWTRESLDQTLHELVDISKVPEGARINSAPRLILWPESPAPLFDNDQHLRESVTALARDQKAYVIVDLVGVLPLKPGASEANLTNRAVLVTPNGEWASHYDKIHLVPFGEYIPFHELFSFASKLTREVGNYQPGQARTLFEIDAHKAGTFVCYESIFPDEVRRFAAEGADLFINLSDDGWYGDIGAPGQHLNMARMRAIENGRWLLRATNTGITASIDPMGRVVAQAPRNQRTTLLAPYSYVTNETVYTRYGAWFAWCCAIISTLGLFVRVRVRAGDITIPNRQAPAAS